MTLFLGSSWLSPSGGYLFFSATTIFKLHFKRLIVLNLFTWTILSLNQQFINVQRMFNIPSGDYHQNSDVTSNAKSSDAGGLWTRRHWCPRVFQLHHLGRPLCPWTAAHPVPVRPHGGLWPRQCREPGLRLGCGELQRSFRAVSAFWRGAAAPVNLGSTAPSRIYSDLLLSGLEIVQAPPARHFVCNIPLSNKRSG